MTSSIHGLMNNTALLITLVLLYDILTLRQVGEKTSVKQAFTGIMLGVIGIAIMSNPWEFSPGVVFDTRSILLCITGFFFGTLPAIITILITGCYRLFLGGSGAWTGVAVIVTSGLVGLAWRHKRKKSMGNISINEFYALGMVVHILMLLWMLTLPWAVAMAVLSKIAIPVLLIFPIGTALIAQLMSNRHASKLIKIKLKESEEKFRTLYNSSPDMYVSVSADDACIMICNEMLLKKTGYSREEMIGSPIYKIYHDDCMDDVKKTFQQFVETGEVTNRKLIVRKKDGSKINVSLNVNAVKNKEGKILNSISSWRDITELKKAENNLKSSQKFLDNIIEQSPYPTWISDTEGTMLRVNPALKKVLHHIPAVLTHLNLFV